MLCAGVCIGILRDGCARRRLHVHSPCRPQVPDQCRDPVHVHGQNEFSAARASRRLHAAGLRHPRTARKIQVRTFTLLQAHR